MREGNFYLNKITQNKLKTITFNGVLECDKCYGKNTVDWKESGVFVKSGLQFYTRLLGQVSLIKGYTCKYWGKEKNRQRENPVQNT